MLPLLPFLPYTVELAVQRLRHKLISAKKRLVILWFMPFGALALWLVSQTTLALLLTYAPLSYTSFRFTDGLAIAYAAGLAERLVSIVRSEGLEATLQTADAFTFADVLLLVLLVLHQLCHIIALLADLPNVRSDVAIPVRAICCLVAWFRILEVGAAGFEPATAGLCAS